MLENSYSKLSISSYKTTQHYLCIKQDERDNIYLNLEL